MKNIDNLLSELTIEQEAKNDIDSLIREYSFLEEVISRKNVRTSYEVRKHNENQKIVILTYKSLEKSKEKIIQFSINKEKRVSAFVIANVLAEVKRKIENYF